jgi:crotonobetainyl-CoA:carnitine CoA-transferase CaiB-like acyl-CoA transferase
MLSSSHPAGRGPAFHPPSSLDDIRVIDATTSVAGPFATMILADLGADVIKIERPGSGDDTRGWGPPFWDGQGATFLSLNRNKRSVVLDLKDQADLCSFRKLLRSADVFVQNLRPGSFAKLGLGYEEVRELNPRLVYCDMTGYGHTGPLGDKPAYDPLMQAFAGLMSLTGEQGRPPVRIPASILDQGTGMWAAIAVLDALRARERTGHGAYLHTSLLNTALMWLPTQVTGYLADGTVPSPMGSGTVGIYPYAAFPASDSYLIIAAGNDSLWRRLCAVLDRADLADDPRFAHNTDRVAHRDELFEEMSGTLRAEPAAVWLERLAAQGVPATPIHTLDQVVEHEQVRAIGALAEAPHPDIDGYTVINLPLQRDGAYPSVRLPPPGLGEHTAEVLAELEEPKEER